MDAKWCANVYETAIERHGTPEILKSDQGVQFTSEVFTEVSKRHGVKMIDGRKRPSNRQCFYRTALA
jgi:putative transposase